MSLKKIKIKKLLRAAFVVTYYKVWKTDALYNALTEDKEFEAIILICPHVSLSSEEMIDELERAYHYFESKGFNVLSMWDKVAGRWIEFDSLDIDLAIFTFPYKITLTQYHEDIFKNYISFYIPYYFGVAASHNYDRMYNLPLHNYMHRIFHATNLCVEDAIKYSSNKGVNVSLTGHPCLEPLILKSESAHKWKPQARNKKKIIFAPHQSIDDTAFIPLSTFLETAEVIKDLAIKYKDSIFWSFKPHPYLKTMLYKNPGWGQEKTESYYSFWESSEFSQYDEGDYVDLFKESDAIIHDCGSFIFEYLLVNKPCAFLNLRGGAQVDILNDIGKEALESYSLIKCVDDIEVFVKSVANGTAMIKSEHKDFISRNLQSLYIDSSPSKKIINIIKESIEGKHEN